MSRCLFGGEVVGAEEWLPSAPFDFRWPGPIRPRRGCNSIRCRRCSAIVRQAPRLEVVNPALDPAVVFLAPDIAAVSGLTPSTTGRLYACGCHLHVEHRYQDLQPVDLYEARGSFGSDWQCADHPPLSIPTVLDGDPIARDIDVMSLVGRRAARPDIKLPDGLKSDDLDVPAFWLLRLYQLLRHAAETDLADRLSTAVAAHLDDLEVNVQLTSLTFFNLLPNAAGAERLSSVTTPNVTTTFAGREWHLGMQRRTALVDRARRTAETVGVDPAALEALKAEVVRPGSADRFVIRLLGELDVDWVDDEAVTIAAAAPSELAALFEALRARPAERLAEIASAIKAVPSVDLNQLRSAVERELTDPELSVVLERILPPAPSGN